MLRAFGDTQKNILHALRGMSGGLTADELAERFAITRTAVRQHMAALEELEYVEQGPPRETGGRPAIIYKLTERGVALFPKQYAWFSELMLQMIRAERGPEGLALWMEEMGRMVGKSLLPKLSGLEGKERLKAIQATMDQMHYEAKVATIKDSDGGQGIEATNCVFHEVASRYPEVCRFDTSMLSTLTGKFVDHRACMVRGGACCRFAFLKK